MIFTTDPKILSTSNGEDGRSECLGVGPMEEGYIVLTSDDCRPQECLAGLPEKVNFFRPMQL